MGDNNNNCLKYQLYGFTDSGKPVTQDTCPPLKESKRTNQSEIQAIHGQLPQLSEKGNPVTENTTNDEVTVNGDRTNNKFEDRSCLTVVCKYFLFWFHYLQIAMFKYFSL